MKLKFICGCSIRYENQQKAAMMLRWSPEYPEALF